MKRPASALLVLAALAVSQGPACVSPMDFLPKGSGGEGGMGGQGGGGVGGTGGAMVCMPGEAVECEYSGPTDTRGVGICQAAIKTCNADGTGFGGCEGEELPKPADDCATPEDDDCNGVAASCDGEVLWARRYGDDLSQFSLAVAVAPDGGPVIGGGFLGTLDFGTGALASDNNFFVDIFVAKLDADGKALWSRKFGDGSGEYARRMKVDAAGNVVILGDFDATLDFGVGTHTSAGASDVFVAKLGPDGAPLWSRSFGDQAVQLGTALAVDSAGSLFVGGRFNGSIDFGTGVLASSADADAYVAKIDAEGAPVWSKSFGGTLDQRVNSLDADPLGAVVAAGSFQGTIDLGDQVHTSAGDSDGFVVKLSPDGSTLWSRTFGDASGQWTSSVTVDPASNILLAGGFKGTVDFGDGPHMNLSGTDMFVAKLDANGSVLWSRTFGDTSNTKSASANAIACDPFGAVLVAGTFDGSVDFGDGTKTSGGASDIFLLKLDSAGSTLWSKRFGDEEPQFQAGVATAATGHVFLTGYLTGTMDFGSMTLTSAGVEDVFLARLTP